MDSVYLFFFFETKRIAKEREREKEGGARLFLDQRNIYKSDVGCRVFSHHTHSGTTEASATDADNRTYWMQREREREDCTQQYCLLIWKRRTSRRRRRRLSLQRRHDNIYILAMLWKMSFLRRNGNGKKITNNNFRCEIIASMCYSCAVIFL